MRAPLSWIAEFVKPGLKPAALADLLTRTGTEVALLDSRVARFRGVVVGRVNTVIKHPGADRLKVCKVTVAAKGAPLTIVCGAPNVAPAQTVAVALPGARIADGTVIERASIRGVESSGMICSMQELGLGSDHAGILVLGGDLQPGAPLDEALALNETIFHFELTPNRSDCFSIQGLGREIAALTGRAFWPAVADVREQGKPAQQSVSVRIADRKLATRYVARVVRGVRIGESPQWLKNRLEACGVRPVSNVVDVTNYVMLELGQPIHAFDLAKLQGRRLVVRPARRGETITLLDGSTHALPVGVPVIADAKRPAAVAAIMGGEASGISAKTKDVVIESATFHPIAIRKASQALGLRTEASHRHEKGPDPATVRLAADRAAQLLAEVAGGAVAPGVVEVGRPPVGPKLIRVSLATLAATLGIKVPAAKAKGILERLGFRVTGTPERWQVAPPTWRVDVRLPEDVTEEVGRVLDYNTFPKTLPSSNLPPVVLPPAVRLEDTVRGFFIRSGYCEALTYPYYGDQHRQLFGLTERHVEPVNPLSPDQAYLRQSLIPRLTEAVGRNRPAREIVKLFEIGSTFVPTGTKVAEQRVVGAVVLAPDAVRVLRGVAEAFFQSGGVAAHAGVTGGMLTWSVSGATAARLSVVPPAATHAFKLRSTRVVAVLEMFLTPLAARWRTFAPFVPFSHFPTVTRDLAFWLPADQPFGPVIEAVKRVDPLLKDVALFDIFTQGTRTSYALRFTLQSETGTLTASDVEGVVNRARTVLQQTFHAAARS